MNCEIKNQFFFLVYSWQDSNPQPPGLKTSDYKYYIVIFERTFYVNYSKIYMFVFIKNCDLKISLLLVNIYINKDYQ